MSILIKSMNMPTSCYDCSFSVEAYEGSGVYSCVITDNCVCKGAERHDDCPLIPVPDHGRLIDTSAKVQTELYDDQTEDWIYADMTVEEYLGYCFNEVPTIIPADKEGEG